MSYVQSHPPARAEELVIYRGVFGIEEPPRATSATRGFLAELGLLAKARSSGSRETVANWSR